MQDKTENEAGREECVTRIEEVDDVEHEKSEEQRKQEEEEEFGERKTTRKHDPRQPSEQQRIAHEMTHLPFRRGGRREKRTNIGIFGGKRQELCPAP